jgi:AcrR family transcriptional regulator
MPKPRLNRTSIVAAAIQMADEQDLAAVTLRGIASRLGVHVTSLYNHVPTKEAVLDEMIRAMIAEAKLPKGKLAWKVWVRRFAAAMRALARKHPGAFEALHYGPAQGERAAEAFEAAFSAFRSAGFDAVSAYGAVKATTIAVLGFILEERTPSRASRTRTDLSELTIERFPYLHEIDRAIAKADTFGYLIDALIDGFSANRTQGVA